MKAQLLFLLSALTLFLFCNTSIYSQDWTIGAITEFHIPLKKNENLFLNRSGLNISRGIRNSEIELGMYYASGKLDKYALTLSSNCDNEFGVNYGVTDVNSCHYKYAALEILLGYKYHFYDLKFKKSKWRGSFYFGLGLNIVFLKEDYSHPFKNPNHLNPETEATGKINVIVLRTTQCIGFNLEYHKKWRFSFEPTSSFSLPVNMIYDFDVSYDQSNPFVGGNIGLKFGVGYKL